MPSWITDIIASTFCNWEISHPFKTTPHTSYDQKPPIEYIQVLVPALLLIRPHAKMWIAFDPAKVDTARVGYRLGLHLTRTESRSRHWPWSWLWSWPSPRSSRTRRREELGYCEHRINIRIEPQSPRAPGCMETSPLWKTYSVCIGCFGSHLRGRSIQLGAQTSWTRLTGCGTHNGNDYNALQDCIHMAPAASSLQRGSDLRPETWFRFKSDSRQLNSVRGKLLKRHPVCRLRRRRRRQAGR